MISFIVPTIARASLVSTLRSIELQAGDEILVVGPVPAVADPRATYCYEHNAHDWGATERTLGMAAARNPYLAFLDDDDVYLPGTRALMADAIARTPDRPVLFRLTYPNGLVLWQAPGLRQGNVSTQMILIPNDPARLGRWSPRREGDLDFLTSMRWPSAAIVWRPEIISRLGHDDYGGGARTPDEAHAHRA